MLCPCPYRHQSPVSWSAAISLPPASTASLVPLQCLLTHGFFILLPVASVFSGSKEMIKIFSLESQMSSEPRAEFLVCWAPWHTSSLELGPRAREMAQWVPELIAVPKDQVPIPNTYLVGSQLPVFMESTSSGLPGHQICTWCTDRQTCRQSTHALKNK